MAIGRNEPCPCGSGKKYKQCCLKKEKVVELGQVKRDHFFQMKQKLSERLAEKVIGYYSFQEYQSLMNNFKKRTGVRDIPDGYAHHWLMFFYRHPAFNGLRGIEWFNKNWGQRDEPALRRMAQTWESLVPRLIQHVDYDQNGVVVEDLFTNDRFHMPYCETLFEYQPWAGTFCLLEELDGSYYMNGVTAIVGPDHLHRAEDHLKSHLQETGESYESAAIDLFPELTGELLRKRVLKEGEAHEVVSSTLYYSMDDVDAVMSEVHRTGRLEMNEWDGHSGKGGLVSQRYRYEDNLAKGSVYLDEVDGIIEIEESQLTFQSFHSKAIADFEHLLSNIPQAHHVKTEEERKMLPVKVQASSYSIAMDEGVPPVFTQFAHKMLLLKELDLPLPQFKGKSPAEMAALKKYFELERWVQSHEYASFHATKRETPQKWTADFNQLRKALNLPLSPFTTLREQRESRLIQLTEDIHWSQDEILMWEELGLPAHERQSPYARDLLTFFQEKGAGRSPNTFYKYRLGVEVLSFFFVEEEIGQPQHLTADQWAALISYYYLEFNSDATHNQAKGFFTAVKSFAAWLDRTYGTKHGPVVKQLVKEMEPDILGAITILETYTPYRERRYDFGPSMGEFRRVFESGEIPAVTEKGYFRVQSVTSTYMNLVKIGEAGRKYKTTIKKEVRSLMQPGMTIAGKLSQKTNWKVYSIETVYPKQAAPYIDFLE
ncbi:hypothetical protein JOC78_002225 [Bacillus ectoiniformans]|uniref:SEC-C metal-binding domain-containing protein n=1 Tax=Bacillus ectoiniformans TaxID=1494429 RepID=UPI00195C1358|nr:hypothetical protein [Bacillus ectoiniformans]